MRRSAANIRVDETMLSCWLLTMAGGLVMIYSASSMLAESRFGSQFLFLRQQFIWVVLSLVAVYVITRLDLKRLAVYSAPALLLTVMLLSVVFIMPARNGSHRWLFLGPMTVQPSELFKFLIIVYLSFSLSNPKRNLSDVKQLVFPYVPIIGVGLALILAQPDLGTCAVIGLTVMGLFYLAGARIKHLALATVPPIAVAALVVFVFRYKIDRVLTYLATISDPLAGSYHVKQAALTLGAGGIFGVGLGDGRQKLFFLPYPHTDFIMASIGEELGLIGLLVLLALLFTLLWRGCRIAAAQPDRFGFLLAAGMTWSLFVNIAINIGVVTALLPVKGLALPFVSYGGSSLLISSAAIGVLLNLSRRTKA